MIKPIAITMGEPAGVGGELTLKAWRQLKDKKLAPFFAIDNIDRLQALGADVPIKVIDNPVQALDIFDTALPVLNIDLAVPPIVGILNPLNGQAILKSIEMAVKFCLEGQAAGLVTNPIHKAALYEVGFQYPGHTEFAAALCGDNKTPVMMLAAKDLRVVPLTVHIPLKEVSAAITEELIFEKTRIVNESLKVDFKLDTPRIAVMGLNPHAGENGKIGLEEGRVIVPALEKLKAEGLQVTGPHPADTLFHEEARQNYDVALGMYHDQALIPLKTLDFYGGVNVTLGLSVVRTSPDHGTALNIAGQGIANPTSFINAILMAAKIASNRNL